ncbi:MAG: hypothetical protein IJS58_07630 [Bacilli bacterium]|nr:hypothetical protein [Bacilli bacterium]
MKKMKKTPKQILREYQPQKPKKIDGIFYRFIMKLAIRKHKAKYFYHFNKKEMKNKQIILLADHANRDIFYYTLGGYYFCNPNGVIGYQNFFSKGTFKLLMGGNLIPKHLYGTDFRTTKMMLRLIKQGSSICLYPEGIQSTHGAMHPMNPSTIKFLKAAKLDVVLASSRGAYLCRPRYTKDIKKGHIEMHFKILFTKEEIETLTEDEIYARYLKEFYYNDFKWNKEHQYKYVGKLPNAKGIDKILYYCPKCHSEFELEIDENIIRCKKCKNEIKLDECYNITPNTPESVLPFEGIDEWYNYQRKLIRELVKQDDYKISFNCYMRELDQDKICKDQYPIKGQGILTIDKTGLTYSGTYEGEEKTLFYDIKSLPSAPFTPGDCLDVPFGDEYYEFEPINKDEKSNVVKYMMVVEEFHNLVDPAWDKVSKDAYGE